jgi:hypothetical protein
MDLFVDEKGIRQPLKVHGTALLALSFQTLGMYTAINSPINSSSAHPGYHNTHALFF